MTSASRVARALSRPDGFTLIEILVAVTVLAVGILGAARLIISSESATLDSELQRIATQEAEQALEEVRAFDYSEIGHPSGDLANGGAPFQAPDAPVAEDIVTAAVGTGVASSRTFEVARGGGKPPATGTIDTYVTWRDEECSPVDVSNLPPIVTLNDRIDSLLEQLDALAGPTGLVQVILDDIDTVIGVVPADPPPEDLKAELQEISPLLETAATQADAAEQNLAELTGMIDLCDVEPADLAGLQTVLEANSAEIATLAADLAELAVVLTGAYGPMQEVLAIVDALLPGQNACGPILDPNDACGQFTSAVQAALHILDPGTGQGEPPSTVLGRVNTTLALIAGADFSGLDRDTTHNTKRITVAISVDTPGADVTPNNQVWLSTVATDPEAGLVIDTSGS